MQGYVALWIMGLGLLAGGAVGLGLKAGGLEIPVITSAFTRVILGVIGTVAIILGFVAFYHPDTSSLAKTPPVTEGAGSLLPLLEFRTSNDAGWFYTLKQTEAEAAVTQRGFIRQGTAGWLHANLVPDTEPLYRLRDTTQSSYLVTGSVFERDKLVQSGQFINEGVLCYIDTAQKPGTVHLMRFSNHNQWRLAPESQTAALQAVGYTLDGPVGWVQP